MESAAGAKAGHPAIREPLVPIPDATTAAAAAVLLRDGKVEEAAKMLGVAPVNARRTTYRALRTNELQASATAGRCRALARELRGDGH